MNWIATTTPPPVPEGHSCIFLVLIDGEPTAREAHYFNRTGLFEDPDMLHTVNFDSTEDGWETGWMFRIEGGQGSDAIGRIVAKVTHYAPMPPNVQQ